MASLRPVVDTPERGAFELYHKLPTELRRKIWHATVDLKPRILPRKRTTELEVCSEGRQFLLEIYQPCFQTLSQRKKKEDHYDALYIEQLAEDNLFPASIYANFAVDAMSFDGKAVETVMGNNGDLSTLLVPEAFAKLQHLAINEIEIGCAPSFLAYHEPERIPLLGQFFGLKTISVIIEVFNGATYVDHEGVLQYMHIAEEKASADEKILVQGHIPGDSAIDEARRAFGNLSELVPYWKAPELQYAEIERDTNE